jgi:hypothetical protein
VVVYLRPLKLNRLKSYIESESHKLKRFDIYSEMSHKDGEVVPKSTIYVSKLRSQFSSITQNSINEIKRILALIKQIQFS